MNVENIVKVIQNTSEYWNLPSKTQFHHAIAQYVTQMVRFNQSRQIRSKLYLLLGDPYSQMLFNSISNDKLFECGLSYNQ